MLSELSIRDIVLIEKLDLQFGAGLTVLTGETGAGKSILLDGLSLALGARGDGSLVRTGAQQGIVTAIFELARDHPVRTLLLDNGLPDEDSLMIKRVQSADGRTRAFINDSPVTANMLKRVGQILVEIHGQHDDRAMLDTSTHRGILDLYGECEDTASAVKSAWANWRAVSRQIDALEARIDEARREGEYLRASAQELEVLAPEPGEEVALADQRQRLMKLEQIASDLEDANQSLSGSASPVPSLSSLTRRLAHKTEQVPGLLEETVEQLDQALDALYQAQNSLERVILQSEFDPKELETSEERLFALRAASRKYSVPVDELPDLAVKMINDVAALETSEADLTNLRKENVALKSEYFRLADELTKMRVNGGQLLKDAIMGELPDLKLEAAEFIVHLETDETIAGPTGVDTVEFWVRTNPGTNPGPMTKVASGGELSRFMLALKVALTDKASAPTLVFDEIDTGVGGAVADAIGRRLARLSERVQVLSVTHAPQVAARANDHLLISKSANGLQNSIATAVQPIKDDGRREEIARMLSGATITDEARAAADRLIAST